MKDTRTLQTKRFHAMITDFLGHNTVARIAKTKERQLKWRRANGIKPRNFNKNSLKPIDVRGTF